MASAETRMQEIDLPPSFSVIDLFAGPGGLGEGFASLDQDGHKPFKVELSVESEPAASRTLKLRAFLRERLRTHGVVPAEYIAFHAGQTPEPRWAEVDGRAWRRAGSEVRTVALGSASAKAHIDRRIPSLRNRHEDSVLLGGPPCQAYSLVGRARIGSVKGYKPKDDPRYFLYREYLRVLHRLRPAAFVMENVKGMLSAAVDGHAVFELFLDELRSPSIGKRRTEYELYALNVYNDTVRLQPTEKPRDFLVRSEQFGVPQRRHRVIIVGLRDDVAHRVRAASGTERWGIKQTFNRTPTVGDALHDLPALRSGLSRGQDSNENWVAVVCQATQSLRRVSRMPAYEDLNGVLDGLELYLEEPARRLRRSSSCLPKDYGMPTTRLDQWFQRRDLAALANHETRSHMSADIQRYLFATVFGMARGRSPKAPDFPAELAPDHRNWRSGVFSDRFRVQVADEPATTVTSHIAKDGHYFIHPSCYQCRSLTVREAARLQTFPDDFLFLGNRTQQYVQVGNAVPPLLAQQIAKLVWQALAA